VELQIVVVGIIQLFLCDFSPLLTLTYNNISPITLILKIILDRLEQQKSIIRGKNV